MAGVEQHDVEIRENREVWQSKPLLREIYHDFYERIHREMDPSLAGVVLELGSGIGNFKAHFPSAITSDLFPNPWLDLACDAYRLPFGEQSLSHVILFDVFQYMEAKKIVGNIILIMHFSYISLFHRITLNIKADIILIVLLLNAIFLKIWRRSDFNHISIRRKELCPLPKNDS